ncbi:MAG: hypothetical protein Q4C73_06615 [Eubacteriales bacterium]|nr:hypothetical protein [Eubacteriales bacterium]
MKRTAGYLLGLAGLGLMGAGLYVKLYGYSYSVIGGGDGPTSVFIVGKAGSGPVAALIAAGALLIAAAVVLAVKKK